MPISSILPAVEDAFGRLNALVATKGAGGDEESDREIAEGAGDRRSRAVQAPAAEGKSMYDLEHARQRVGRAFGGYQMTDEGGHVLGGWRYG